MLKRKKNQILIEKTQKLRRHKKNLDLVKKPRSGHTGRQSISPISRDESCTQVMLSAQSPDTLLRLTSFHDLLRPPISHHNVCSVATDHNFTPVASDG